MAELRNIDNTKCWWDEDQMELLYIVGGITNWYRCFGKLTISTNTELMYTLQPSNVAPRYTPNRGATRNMYKDGQSGITSSSQNQETIQMSTINRVVK